MGFMSRAAKRTARQTYQAGIRANDQRLRQQGPTHGYGPDGRYGRIGEDRQGKWGVVEYVLLIAGISVVLTLLAMVGMLMAGTLSIG
jgi:hypothetical protein